LLSSTLRITVVGGLSGVKWIVGTADIVPLELAGSHARELGNLAGAHDVERALVLGAPSQLGVVFDT